MSNMQPVIPRFYCDWINYLIHIGRMATTDVSISGLSMGADSSVIEMFDMTPSNLQTITASGLTAQGIITINTNITTDDVQDTSFVLILGHNLKQADAKFVFQHSDDASFTGGGGTEVRNPALTEVINIGGDVAAGSEGPGNGNYATPASNGYSLFTFTPGSDNQYMRFLIDDVNNDNYDADIKIGCILVGKYVDAPNRPDQAKTFNLEQSSKLVQTDGGMTYSNMKAVRGPNWFLSPYEVGTGSSPTIITRSGRYAQDWTFSFVLDANFIPDNFQTSTNLLTGTTMLNILQYTADSHFPCFIQLDNTGKTEFLFARIIPQGPPTTASPGIWTVRWRIVEEY